MTTHDSEWFIAGIQQIGVGVPDVTAAFAWHRRTFGMDVPIFDDDGETTLMLRYTGGKPQARRAILAANLAGGGAFEIWQYKSRAPVPPAFEAQLGDLGIVAARMKAPDVGTAYEALRAQEATLLGPVASDPSGSSHFFLKDPLGLIYEVVEGDGWIGHPRTSTGGVAGCMIGVSSIDRALPLYRDLLGYDHLVYDATGSFEDLYSLPGGRTEVRRVLLSRSAPPGGAFSRLLGPSRIELVESLGRVPRRIYEGRTWGDIGFIQLCFDVSGMDALGRDFSAHGFAFTVDSANAFGMSDASGRFCYVEDPDGTLIELVETHRVPIAKKLGLYLDFAKRNPRKPLPRWMIRAMGLGRVKD